MKTIDAKLQVLQAEYSILEEKLDDEKDHSAFLEKLLRILYGEGWNKLTIYDAQQIGMLHQHKEKK